MKKKFTSIFICVVMMMCYINTDVFAQNISVKLNGNDIYFDVNPQIIEDRTMVPMRAIFEKLGYNISWDERAKKITALGSNETIIMIIGQHKFYINELEYITDVAPTIVNGRTLVPLRALGESLNYDVYWDQYHSIVWLYPMSNITMNEAINIAKNYVGKNDNTIWYIGGLNNQCYLVTYASPPYYMPEYGGGGIQINKNTGNVEFLAS